WARERGASATRQVFGLARKRYAGNRRAFRDQSLLYLLVPCRSLRGTPLLMIEVLSGEMKPASRASLGWLVRKSAFILQCSGGQRISDYKGADRDGLHRPRLAHGVAPLVNSLGFQGEDLYGKRLRQS